MGRVSFETMIFDYNEGLQRAGVLPDDRYITGFAFIMSYVLVVVLVVAFYKIVVWSEWYEERQEKIESLMQKLIPIVLVSEALMILLIALYFEEYAAILIVTTAVVVALAIATRKEFAGLRAYLDEKFGWLF